MRSRLRFLVAVIAVAFFGAPLVLRAVGVRAQPFENTVLAPAPKLSQGWEFFDGLTRYLIDRMPLRQDAVRANTWIDEHVFHTTPRYGLGGLGGVQTDQALPFVGSPYQDKGPPPRGASASSQVVTGLHGWLFLQEAFNNACSPYVPFMQALSGWEMIIRAIRASGRTVRLFVAPDKSTIYPEYVSPSTPNLTCAQRQTVALWKLLESPAAYGVGVTPLREALLAAKQMAAGPLYYPNDSHWDSEGSLTFLRATLPLASKTIRLLPTEIIHNGETNHVGDLTSLLGTPKSAHAPLRTILRRPGAPVIPGPSVLVGDSYGELAFFQLTPYFASIKMLSWVNNDARQIVQGIADSRIVILETVERYFDYRGSAMPEAVGDPAFMRLLREALRAHPVPPPSR